MMDRWLGQWSGVLYAMLRVMTGLLFLCHGSQKLFGIPDGRPAWGSPLMTAAGVIEFGAGLLIAVGLFTTYAAFLASGEMAFAYFLVHAGNGFWPILNRGELPILYCFVFLYIASRGAGQFSVDQMWSASA